MEVFSGKRSFYLCTTPYYIFYVLKACGNFVLFETVERLLTIFLNHSAKRTL